jgi:hypothetical protein
VLVFHCWRVRLAQFVSAGNDVALIDAKKRIQRVLPQPMWRLAGDMYYFARLPFMWGESVVCACCGWRFRRFVRAICSPHPVVCPRCFSTPRDRFMWLYLTRHLITAGERVRLVHFAPERRMRRNIRRLPHVGYVSADINCPFADIKMDIEQIPFADCSVGGIICSHVLEHVRDDRRAMREIFRVLGPHGWALLVVPLDRRLAHTFEDGSVNTASERERVFGHDEHVRLYGRDFGDRLADAGFVVQKIECVTTFGEAEVVRFCLDREEDIYICRKPR